MFKNVDELLLCGPYVGILSLVVGRVIHIERKNQVVGCLILFKKIFRVSLVGRILRAVINRAN